MQKKVAIILGIFLAVFLLAGLLLFYRSYSKLRMDSKTFNNLSCGNLAEIGSQAENFSRVGRTMKPFGIFSKSLKKKAEILSDTERFTTELRYYLGCESERNYLVLLQDNAELRPSGGFWGSYGVLKVKSGEITSFTTHNSYDLDLVNRGRFEAPASTEGIFEDEWRFWNSNWWPDFKDSVNQGLFFIDKAGISGDKYDAAIGLNIDYLLQLLKISGPVQVPNYDFAVDADNFIQKMVYEPSNPAIYKEKELDLQYLNPQDKKPLLADLAKKIIEQIIETKKEKLFALATYQGLNEQNVVIYNFDENRHSFLRKYLWTGEISTDKNVAVVCDANVGSKLDFFIEKKSKLRQLGDGEYEMTLEYKNTYSTASKTLPYSIYRDYLRVFVPEGSELLSFEGGDSEAKLIDQEVTKLAAVKVLLLISPGQTRTFKFRWRIPESIRNQKIELLRQSGSKLDYK